MEETSAPRPAIRWDVAVPVLLFAIALALRLVGIGWGLKNDLHWHSYHPDEAVVFSYSQAIEPTKGDFTPGFYNYGTLYLTALKFAGDMVATYTGGFDPQKPQTVADFMSRGHMAGRVLSALAGAGTVWVVFLILRRRTNLLGSIMGALLIAVAPAHVVHSHFQTVDIVAAFFVALSTHYALKLIPSPSRLERDGEGESLGNLSSGEVSRDGGGETPDRLSKLSDDPTDALKNAILAGLFAGLATGTKYTGGLVILTLVAALVYRFLSERRGAAGSKPQQPEILLALSGFAAMAVAFVLSTPGVVADSEKFLKDFTYEMRHTATGHGLIFTNTPSGFFLHIVNLVVGVGLILTILGLSGLTLAAVKKHAWAVALLAFLIPYYLLIGRAEVKFLRYTFPMYIGLAVGFGWLMGKGHDRRLKVGGIAVGLGIAGLGGLDRGGLMGSVNFTNLMVREDPRDQAARYLKDQAKSNPDLLVAYASDPWYYSAPLFLNSAAPRWIPLEARQAEMQQATAPKVAFYTENPQDPFAFDARMIDALKPDYITFSSFEVYDLQRLSASENLDPIAKLQVDRWLGFKEKLDQDYKLERLFGAGIVPIHDLEYVQPQIMVYRRK